MGEGTASAPVVARPAWGDDLARFGDHPALSTPTGTVTYADLDLRVAQAREDLAALGPGQLVRLRPATTTDFVVAWLAACTGSHAALVTHDDGLARAYGVSVERGAGEWHPTGRTAPALHPDLRLLLSTSGSTGSPKLVRLSATNLDANADAIADYLGLGHGDVALTTLPLDYCYGLSVLHSHLLVGATVVLDDRSVTDPALWGRAREEGVTSFAGVPHTFDLLGAAGWPHLPSLRQVTQAGGRLAPERVQALAGQGRREGWDLVVMYGQTEATARMAWLPPDLAAAHPATVGVAIPGGSFRLAPVEGAQEGVGELVYAGPNVMMGYAESPADLARGPELDELPTGDLARFTPEGLVEIVGRRSRFAKLFGQRIDLDRVQTLLGLGGLDVVCAESADGAQLVIAVPGCTGAGDDMAALDEVRTVAAEATGLPAHALLVVPVGEVPRLPNGKVDHQSVARLVPRTSIEPADSEASIARLYARILGVSEVSPARSFVDLGGDSLSYVELSLRLEQRIGRLPEDWPTWSIADLSALAGGLDRAERPRRPWARVDTTIVLRALAIVLIVGSHTDLWVVLGGAHVLLAVAGANFARFSLADEGPRARLRRIGRAASRIAVPAVLWIGAVAVLTGAPGWRSVLLVNDVLGSHDWSEPNWYYWFIEVVLLCCLGAGLLAAIPRVAAVERRHRFALALTLTVAALVPRWWATWSAYDGDVIHSSLFVAWLFLGGWAAQVAGNRPQRALATAVLLAGVVGFTGSVERDLLIAAGVVTLVWAPTVPWPPVLVASTGTVASASLYIYLTHWQVYPWFEDRWPLGGLIASLAVGIATWRLVERVSSGSRHEDPRRRRTPARSGAPATSNLPSNTPIGTR